MSSKIMSSKSHFSKGDGEETKSAQRFHKRQKALSRNKVSGMNKPHQIKVKNHKGNDRPPRRVHRTIHHHVNHRKIVKMFKRHLTQNSGIGTASLFINTKRDQIQLSEEMEFDPSQPDEFIASDAGLSERELANRLSHFVREMILNGMT